MVLLKRIEEFPDYWISLDGEVWSEKCSIFLKQSIDSGGYLFVRFQKDKKQYTKSIHRLLGEAFIEKIEGYDVVDHIDKNKINNSLSNLRWTRTRGNCHNRKDQSLLGHCIYFLKNRKTAPYRVQIVEDGKKPSKYFKTHAEAIIYRDEYLNNL